MASFTDRTGRNWRVTLTVGHLTPLKELYGIDLGKAVRSQADFAALFDLAPQDLVGSLWLICEGDATAAGLTPETWAHRFDGAAIEGATVALAEAVIGFFPRQQIAQAMSRSLPKLLAAMDVDLMRKLDHSISTALAGNWPASSESIPAG